MDSPAKKDSAVVLVSGGIESSILLWEAANRYPAVHPVYVQNGLRWEYAELFCLKNYLRHLKSDHFKPLKVIELTMRDLYEKHWSITGIKIPDARSNDNAVYLPGRNLALLSKTAVYAAMHDVSVIEIGILKGNPFDDSSSAFFRKMAGVLSLGLGKPIEIRSPFSRLRKEEVILMGKKLPLEFTFSCINPKGYDHCGECNKCIERKKAFFAAGVFDKTNYKKKGI